MQYFNHVKCTLTPWYHRTGEGINGLRESSISVGPDLGVIFILWPLYSSFPLACEAVLLLLLSYMPFLLGEEAIFTLQVDPLGRRWSGCRQMVWLQVISDCQRGEHPRLCIPLSCGINLSILQLYLSGCAANTSSNSLVLTVEAQKCERMVKQWNNEIQETKVERKRGGREGGNDKLKFIKWKISLKVLWFCDINHSTAMCNIFCWKLTSPSVTLP